jgi:D-alanine--poly(phosphoribitol) ligase subunit 1
MNYKVKLENYYLNILNNMESNSLFYRYYENKYTYRDFKNYSTKIICLIDKYYNNQKKKPIIFTYSNKSFEMYASIFPLLISGAIWVPLSINYPFQKIRDIMDQINPDIFLYDEYLDEKIIKFFKKKKVKLVNFKSIHNIRVKKVNYKKVINKIDFLKTSFVYFTSGSTGKPKGIKVSHKNIISDIFSQKKHLYKKSYKNLIFGDYYDTAFSIFFDIYFPAIFFKSCISPGKNKSDIFNPINHIKLNKVNVFISVPSTIQRIKDFNKLFLLNIKFEIIIITGEPFYLSVLDYIFKNFQSKKVFNCYGGTEMGNWVFYHLCRKTDIKNYSKFNLVPIGKNFSSVSYKIIKKELVVQGPMITNGYLNKDLNKNKFYFQKPNNIFYTSDFATRYKKVLICKGRNDNMIKLRGYRVELPEIEANVRKIPYVKQCVVFHVKKNSYNNYLVAVISIIGKLDEITVRKDLSDFLPNYMIPKKIILKSRLPINLNGKIDRKKISKTF